MKNLARITLLFLWLFAITAPSIITLMDVDRSIVLTNVNEEEQQESSKKSQAEEKMVKDTAFNFLLETLHKNSVVDAHRPVGYKGYILEIISPPPELYHL